MMPFSIGTRLERVGVVGPDSDLLVGWDVGSWIIWAEVGSLQCWSTGSHSSAKTRKKGVRRGLCPWLLRCLSQFLSERKKRDCLECECVVYEDAYQCACVFAYLSSMGWPCIYSRCSISWMVIRSPSHWMGYFLL